MNPIVNLLFFLSLAQSSPPTIDSLRIAEHAFTFSLASEWQIAERSDTGAYPSVLFKRKPVVDKNGIEVIPNILIKLITIDPLAETKDDDTPMLTRVCLLNFAPPEALADFERGKGKVPKFLLPFRNAISFNSPYKDNFRSAHTCLYLTAFIPGKFGVFIVIDSTEEVFKKIEAEIVQFCKGVTG